MWDSDPAENIAIRFTNDPKQSEVFLVNDVLGVGKSIKITYEEMMMGIFGMTIKYESVHKRSHECLVTLDEQTLMYVQAHKEFPTEADDLLATTAAAQ